MTLNYSRDDVKTFSVRMKEGKFIKELLYIGVGGEVLFAAEDKGFSLHAELLPKPGTRPFIPSS